MASKTAFMAVVLLVLVAGDLAGGHVVPPLRRGTRSHGWMQGIKGGLPTGTQPSDTISTACQGAISWVDKGRGLCAIALIIFWWYDKKARRKRSKQSKANRTAASSLARKAAGRKASSSRLHRDSSSRPFPRTLPDKRSHHRASMHACHGIDHH
ncbi:hypothetical protein VPH35_113366 [Triticum aestivum]|uniref:uncharacterized protein n=1 Tax=Triticum aestivum TaxID=4565 RepID=UPI000845544B|nr:uncharacterized protein LOC123134938 [Triticum aestivum]